MLEHLSGRGYEIVERLLASEDLGPLEEGLRGHRPGPGRAGARGLLSIPGVRDLAAGEKLSRLGHAPRRVLHIEYAPADGVDPGADLSLC